MRLGTVRRWIGEGTLIALVDIDGTFIEYTLGSEKHKEPLDNEKIITIEHRPNTIDIQLDVKEKQLTYVNYRSGRKARRKYS